MRPRPKAGVGAPRGAAQPAPPRDDAEAPAKAAERILVENGVRGSVRAAGREGEVAAVAATPGLLPAIARLAPSLKGLGFRYVALELAGDEEFPTTGYGSGAER